MTWPLPGKCFPVLRIMESKLIHKVEPIYREQALKARLSGNVVLEVTVNEEGLVSRIQVVSGHPILREAAIEAVKQWQYSPTLLNGEPFPVIATVTIIFRIDGQKEETGSDLNAASMPSQKSIVGNVIFSGGGSNWHIVCRAAPIDEKGSPSLETEKFIPPQLIATPQPNFQWLLKWGTMAEAGWPVDVGKGTPLAYSFIVNEVGEITNFTRVQGPEVPDLEKELSQLSIVSPGRRGSTPVRTWCIIEIRARQSPDEI
jgi:TonB family protein